MFSAPGIFNIIFRKSGLQARIAVLLARTRFELEYDVEMNQLCCFYQFTLTSLWVLFLLIKLDIIAFASYAAET